MVCVCAIVTWMSSHLCKTCRDFSFKLNHQIIMVQKRAFDYFKPSKEKRKKIYKGWMWRAILLNKITQRKNAYPPLFYRENKIWSLFPATFVLVSFIPWSSSRAGSAYSPSAASSSGTPPPSWTCPRSRLPPGPAAPAAAALGRPSGTARRSPVGTSRRPSTGCRCRRRRWLWSSDRPGETGSPSSPWTWTLREGLTWRGGPPSRPGAEDEKRRDRQSRSGGGDAKEGWKKKKLSNEKLCPYVPDQTVCHFMKRVPVCFYISWKSPTLAK